MSDKNKSTPSLWSLIKSILAAAIGVQSSKNREQDFQQKSILPFIVGGIIFTVLFIASLVFIVNIILSQQ